MNGASMVKSRIPDTHYCPRVRRWNTRHGDRGNSRERKKQTWKDRVCVRERDLYSVELTLHYTLTTVVLSSKQSVSPLFKVCAGFGGRERLKNRMVT